MGSTTSAEDIPPTRKASDSSYFTSHNESQNSATRNEPLDCQTLLQSYGHLYAGYLESIRKHFASENGNPPLSCNTATVVLASPVNKATPLTTSDKIEKKVSIQFKLSHGGVNKILNQVAKSGRFHDDHKITVTIRNVKIPENMRTILYERFCDEAKRNDGCVEFRSMAECGFPMTFEKVAVNFSKFQTGWGVMGTHTTHVELNDDDGDVEFAVIQ